MENVLVLLAWPDPAAGMAPQQWNPSDADSAGVRV